MNENTGIGLDQPVRVTPELARAIARKLSGPDGTIYQNTDSEWKWLYNGPGKSARWLGYVPFGQIIDQRNAEPVIQPAPAVPQERILPTEDASSLVPDEEYFAPEAHLEGVTAAQPHRLAIVGEKSSLEPVLGPVAAEYGADLCLPTSEISDTQLYRMASLTAAEQRPLIVFYFADCDPAGWQMGISVARKLQALSELLGPYGFEVHQVALTPDEVRGLRLPSTPLKDTERRADKWHARTGIRQTEIDAAITLCPAELAQLAREAIGPFFDATLDGRFGRARPDWLAEAQQVIDDHLDGGREKVMATARDKLSQARALVDEVSESLQTSAEPDDLPLFDPPEPRCHAGDALPSGLGPTLVISKWSYPEQCQALKDSKAYGGDEDGSPEEGDGDDR